MGLGPMEGCGERLRHRRTMRRNYARWVPSSRAKRHMAIVHGVVVHGTLAQPFKRQTTLSEELRGVDYCPPTEGRVVL